MILSIDAKDLFKRKSILRGFFFTATLIPLFLFRGFVMQDPPSEEEDTSRMKLPSSVRPVGTIVPQPSSPENFQDTPTPVTFRIQNRSLRPIYLQGMKEEAERLQLFFYHRDEGKGWTPFFEFLPCDLPTCRNLHAPKQSCSKQVPYIVSLGPSGSPDSVKEVQWSGLLYQRSEATQENRNRRYCYKGWVPKSGRMRIELEFSETTQEEKGKPVIGGRDHAVVEFDLPPSRTTLDIVLGE